MQPFSFKKLSKIEVLVLTLMFSAINRFATSVQKTARLAPVTRTGILGIRVLMALELFVETIARDCKRRKSLAAVVAAAVMTKIEEMGSSEQESVVACIGLEQK